jgi:PAS domain S-box-containing protein
MIIHLTKIRTRLTALLLLSSLIATTIACTALTSYWISLRVTALGDDLETTANALGDTCRATIAFNLPGEAQKLLQTLRGKPTIDQAFIFTSGTQPFAGYLRNKQPGDVPERPDGPYPVRRLSWNSLEIAAEIVQDGERIGVFYLRDDLSAIWASLSALLLVTPLVVLASLGLTYVALLRLQRRITRPILSLAETAAIVSTSNDYSLRASKQSPDEIGDLTDAFNSMLEKIETASLALRESEQRYRNLLDTTPLPILVHTEGILLYLNPAAAQLLQQDSIEALADRSLLSFLCTPADQAKLLTPSSEPPSPGVVRQYTFKLCVSPDQFIDVAATSIDMDYDGCHSQLVICVDVTEQLQTARQLEDYRNHLEALVEERTAELSRAQEQLVLKERLAVLGQLTATVSHELRNPLGSIGNALFNLGMSLEANRTDLAEGSLQLASRNVERCDRIINELLDYSRKGKINEQEIAIDPWLEDLLGELTWPADIRLLKGLHCGVRILGDGDRLRRAVLNLLINAQQALQEVSREEKYILVETRNCDRHLEIIIEDNGPGIPEGLRTKIYEPLFSTKNFGIGLGMSVVEEVMRSHQGGVELQTPVGHGCRFVLWLPHKMSGERDAYGS